MSIDRIGKGAPPVPQTGNTGATPGVDRPFEAPRSAAAEGATPVGAASPLERLRAGELTLDQYLDIKVEDALRAVGKVGAADREVIRHTLRDALASDPGLADLVRQATGHMPASSDE